MSARYLKLNSVEQNIEDKNLNKNFEGDVSLNKLQNK